MAKFKSKWLNSPEKPGALTDKTDKTPSITTPDGSTGGEGGRQKSPENPNALTDRTDKSAFVSSVSDTVRRSGEKILPSVQEQRQAIIAWLRQQLASGPV